LVAPGGLSPVATMLSPTASVSIDAVSTLEGIAALKPSYEHLLALTDNKLPFAQHDWHLAWCRHFLNCNPRVHDEPLFCVMRNAFGVCVGIVPLVISRRWVGPLKIVSVNLLGADPAITEIRAPLIHPGYEWLTARAVQDRLASVGDWDWIHWTGISAEFAAALAVRGTLQSQPALSDFVLDLPASWEEFRSRLKRNIRESLRHCYNSLKRDNLEHRLTVMEDPGEVRPALERFFKLHVMRANLTNTVAHPNRFESKVSREFLLEVCERMARRGVLRIFQLEVGPHTVAMRLGFVVRDSLYLYYSGFDPAWSRYSVMTTTVAEAIKYAIAQGLKTVNLSPTADVSKMRWGPRQVDYRAAYELNGRLRSRLARNAYMKARSGEGLQAWVLQHLIQARRQWR
jgi:CelD/BcsL family acetyltransferase involved in cellulose biosynthesis